MPSQSAAQVRRHDVTERGDPVPVRTGGLGHPGIVDPTDFGVTSSSFTLRVRFMRFVWLRGMGSRVVDWYQRVLVDTGRAAAVWALIGFLVTFAITRGITRRIRAKNNAPPPARPRIGLVGGLSDIYIAGVHVHHQVWGILLVLLSGLLEFRFDPDSPWTEVLAALFGIGAALALDEFALWFHLDDVYWGAEGRKSIDAILIGGALGAALLLQGSPVGAREIGRCRHLAVRLGADRPPGSRGGLFRQGQDRHRHDRHRDPHRCDGWSHPARQADIGLGPAAVHRGTSSPARNAGSMPTTSGAAIACGTASVDLRNPTPARSEATAVEPETRAIGG